MKAQLQIKHLFLAILLFNSCGKTNQGTERKLTPYERWQRFTHFSDPSWNYQAARQYVSNTDFTQFPFTMITREAWGARPPKNPLDHIGLIDGIVIHHSLTSDRVTPKSIQDFHMDSRGWDDIAYHYLIARDDSLNWKIFEGRRLPALGAHAGRGNGGQNLNIGKIGIVLIGNFGMKSSSNPEGWPSSAPEHQRQPEQEVVKLLGVLVNELLNSYSGISSIYTHRTSPYNINPEGGICPGEGAVPVFESFMNKFALSSAFLPEGHSFF